jgi:uncharacterized protein YoxC
MNVVRIRAPLAAMLSALALAVLPAYSIAQQQRDPPMSEAARTHEYMEQRIQKHLDRLAARLEIRASQQEAWKAFSTAVRSMAPDKPRARAAEDVDAAARARQMADRVSERARKLTQLADATAKLQQSLDPSQKEVLNEVARNFGSHFAMHGEGMHGSMHEGHCGGTRHEGHGMFQHHGEDGEHHGAMSRERSDAGEQDGAVILMRERSDAGEQDGPVVIGRERLD